MKATTWNTLTMLARDIERLQQGIALYQGRLAGLDGYEQTLNLLNGRKPTAVLEVHFNWLDQEKRQTEGRLAKLQAELNLLLKEQKRIEAESLERLIDSVEKHDTDGTHNGTPVQFVGTDKPLGGQFNGHRKNPKQVERSIADLRARGKAPSGNGHKSGRKDGKDRNARGKKARKAKAMQAA